MLRTFCTATILCWASAMLHDDALPEPHHHSAFARAVLNPIADVPKGIVRANRGDPTEAFNVYRNNVVASLAEALKGAYPVTAHLLGDGLQRALMADFVRQHPPKSAVLSAYGGAFPGFLARHPTTKAKPFLADVALLECRRIEAYHAADAQALEGASLAGIAPDALSAGTFLLHPAVRLVASRFPIASIHAIETAALAGHDTQETRTRIDLRRSEAVLITRPHYEVDSRPISRGYFAFLNACARHAPFGAAADAGFKADERFDLQACLTLCLTAGAFRAFQPSDSFPST